MKIIKNGEYNNLKPASLKPKEGIPFGEFATVTKKFAKGKEYDTKYGKSFLCMVTFEEEECSFWLKPELHALYEAVGGEGDNIKIFAEKNPVTNPKNGSVTVWKKLRFELA